MAPLSDFKGTPRFQVIRRIGAGGMGVVYEALDRERGVPVALKTLRSLDAKALYRFKSEFRALADLDHPNLVRLGELFGEGEEWFFTMELLAGQDFLAWVRADPFGGGVGSDSSTDLGLPPDPPTIPITGAAAKAPTSPASLPHAPPPMDERRLRDALGQLAQGLAALHRANKVHRDVKPSNVLVTPAGRLVLLDFGLATDATRRYRQNSATSIVGTAAYMAPEQAAQVAVGPEADWYAVGSMLYQALTGQTPFLGGAVDVLMKKQAFEPPPPRALVPDAPPDLDALCVALLRRDPRDRPAEALILERLGAMAAPAQAGAASSASWGTEAPPFVGRERELAGLDAAFAEADAGLPISMFVLGESGMGKSALVHRFLDGVEKSHPGALILTGRCYEREALPFKAFDAVVDALASHLTRMDQEEVAAMLPRDAATLARVFPVLRTVPAVARAGEARVADPQQLRARAFAALRTLLSGLTARRTVVLFIDDFQWADADSLALFTSVMHGLEAPPLFFVATVRVSAEEVARGWLPRSLSSVESVPGDLRTLGVAALPEEQAMGLARLVLRREGGGGEEAVGAIAREAGGHPLFIQELARHLGGRGGGAEPAQARLDDALWARIGLLEPAARRLLEVLAVGGEPLPQRVVERAAALDADELHRLAGVLRVGQLARTSGLRGADTIECYHDRTREAVVARLDAEALRRHHESLANALEASATGSTQDAQAIVRHLDAAGLSERAAEQAVRAARLASHALAFDQAAAMFATALRLGRHTEAAARALRLEMADALVAAGRGTDAAAAYLEASEGADAATRLECRNKAAGHFLITGDIERGMRTLDSVLSEIGERLASTPKTALASLLWSRLRLRLRGLGFTPRDESVISPRDLVRIDIYQSVGIGLSLVDVIRGADFQARGLLLALRTGERHRVARAIGLDAGFIGSQDARSNARARKLAERCAEIVIGIDDPYLDAWAIGTSGLVHYLGGRFSLGAEQMAAAEVPLREKTTGRIWELNTMRLFGLLALRYLGRWRELRRGLGEHLRDAVRRGDRYAETTLSRALNLVWLAAGDPQRARRELAERGWTPPEGAYHMQNWYLLRARLEIALYEGEAGAAQALLAAELEPLERSLLPRAQTIRSELAWLRARVALATAAKEGQRWQLEQARRMARKLRRERVGYTQAWAALVEAGAAMIEGGAAAARPKLEQALALAEANELSMCAAAARLALGDERASDAMEAEGVRRPERIAAMLAPGLLGREG